MARIVVVSNRKGGVGKTTTAVTLAHGLALQGRSVLLVDLDPQGHCAPALGCPGGGQVRDVWSWLGSRSTLGDAVVLARPKQAERARELWLMAGSCRTALVERKLLKEEWPQGWLADRLRNFRQRLTRLGNGELMDWVVVDTGPSVSLLQEEALWAADLVVIPSAVDWLSSAGIADLVGSLEGMQARGWRGRLLGVLPTFFDEVTRESKGNLEDLGNAFGELVLPPIHRATLLRSCAAEGRTVWEAAPGSRAADEYARLVWRVRDCEV